MGATGDGATIAKEVRGLVGRGELLEAVDVARKAGASSAPALTEAELQAVRIEEIVALARLASFDEAQEKFEAYELHAAPDLRARSLLARFRKDLGFSIDEPSARASALRESRDIYLELAREHDPDGDAPDAEQYEYNGVNAVTLSRMIDDMDAVADVVAKLERVDPAPSYWSLATRAELLLAKGAPEEVVAEALSRAAAAPDAGPGSVATTLRQLMRVAPDHPALAVLKPGPILHYSGHMIAPPGARYGRVLAANEATLRDRIEAKLSALAPSAVFGSLASGADILIVEWALRNGCEARVFLPFATATFFARSIDSAGGDWAARARACLDHPACRLLHLTRDKPPPGDDFAYNAVSRFAMGGAILRAARIGADAEQLVVWDGEVTGGVAGASADRAMWARAGRRAHEVDVSDLGAKSPEPNPPAPPPPHARAPKAIVFGDVKNFSKLAETQLPQFVETVMGAVAGVFEQVKARYGEGAVSFVNTWGDGVFAVFETAAAAAWFALRLQQRMNEVKPDLPALGLPETLSIRLGMHFGVVYPLTEPVTGSPNFFGEAVARAARIEPITTEGRVFVSEEFAAELALDPDSPAVSEYVGEIDTAKKYGAFRLYRIKEI